MHFSILSRVLVVWKLGKIATLLDKLRTRNDRTGKQDHFDSGLANESIRLRAMRRIVRLKKLYTSLRQTRALTAVQM